jgi:hypothetical protein
MELKTATIEDVLATFSSHLSKSYPSPEAFRRNFDLLLKGKRERPGPAGYPVSLERNIVFLNDLVAEAEAFVERMLAAGAEGGVSEDDIASVLEAIETKAHEANARRHREVFVEGASADFKEMRADRDAGGGTYLDKLEFNYRYLMTLRIFLFEFISVLAAIRAGYAIRGEAGASMAKVRSHLEVTVHYYIGNVAVDGSEAPGPGSGPADGG